MDKIIIWCNNRSLEAVLMRVKQESRLLHRVMELLNNLGKESEVTIKLFRSNNVSSVAVSEDITRGPGWPKILPEFLRPMAARKIFEQEAHKEWQRAWTMETTCRQTKRFWPSIRPEISKEILSMDREDLSRIIQIVTGHGFNRYHLSLQDPNTDKLCRFCLNETEDTWHIVTICPSFAEARLRFFKEGRISFPEDIPRLSAFFKEIAIDSLFCPPE